MGKLIGCFMIGAGILFLMPFMSFICMAMAIGFFIYGCIKYKDVALDVEAIKEDEKKGSQ